MQLVCRNWTAKKFYSIGSIFHLFPMKGSRGDLLTGENIQLPAFSDSPDGCEWVGHCSNYDRIKKVLSVELE